ncbi:MAG: hypothetical protein U0Y82_14825 [Thermoleophilia bacterium]
MKRPIARAAAAAATAAALVVPMAATGALPAFGTAGVTLTGNGHDSQLYSVSAAKHPTFDRVVFRFRFGVPRVDARYVTKVLHDGSGLPVALKGNRYLEVAMQMVHTDATAGHPTNVPMVLTPLLPMLRQLKQSGDFEGVVSYGFGLKAKNGYRVFRLSHPTRVVIDFKH